MAHPPAHMQFGCPFPHLVAPQKAEKWQKAAINYGLFICTKKHVYIFYLNIRCLLSFFLLLFAYRSICSYKYSKLSNAFFSSTDSANGAAVEGSR